MHVAALWRYPVKSMAGEQLDSADIGTSGVAGDRRWAVVDCRDGQVASAKHPRKWAALLECRAATEAGGVRITLPDGTTVHSGDADVDGALSSCLGRDVTLTDVVPEGAAYEADWPAGTIPESILEQTAVGEGDEGTLTRLPLMAPDGFFDVAPLHLIGVASLDAVGDVRRFRPNVVIAGGRQPFEENGWVGRTLRLGAASATVRMSTMRCVMTTLPQGGLPRDRGVLRTLTERNRREIPGMGTWSCLGAYADVAEPGRVRVGDDVSAG